MEHSPYSRLGYIVHDVIIHGYNVVPEEVARRMSSTRDVQVTRTVQNSRVDLRSPGVGVEVKESAGDEGHCMPPWAWLAIGVVIEYRRALGRPAVHEPVQ